jgi:hypothetical protein
MKPMNWWLGKQRLPGTEVDVTRPVEGLDMQKLCDYPEAYENQPGFDFIKEVPTVWDETKVLGAEVSEYMIMAREKNSVWYVGSITRDPRDVTV